MAAAAAVSIADWLRREALSGCGDGGGGNDSSGSSGSSGSGDSSGSGRGDDGSSTDDGDARAAIATRRLLHYECIDAADSWQRRRT